MALLLPWKSKSIRLDHRQTAYDDGQKADVTVILTVWKRNNLDEQITALLNQTLLPANIWILHYSNHVSVSERLKNYSFVDYFYAAINLKYFGRHTLAQHSSTEYTWILDDDIIPSRTWIETCIKTCELKTAIVCSNGRIIPPNDFSPELPKDSGYMDKYFVGDSKSMNSINLCEKETLVDYGCSSFFFRTIWRKYFWSIWPYTFQTGEDMHLSASCKIRDNISTIIPQQKSLEDSGNLKPVYSVDEYASWKKPGFVEQRARVLKYLIEENSWTPILWSR